MKCSARNVLPEMCGEYAISRLWPHQFGPLNELPTPVVRLESGEQRLVDLKIGDQVLFGKYSGPEIKVADEELLAMREDDIMGVIES